ncbi:MAG TPA: hypothetical protein VNU46_08855 [Gemmatimonadaceae bacterium]|nr:hypothetical protein [Gemmatimonadaceae bacterium]
MDDDRVASWEDQACGSDDGAMSCLRDDSRRQLRVDGHDVGRRAFLDDGEGGEPRDGGEDGRCDAAWSAWEQ